VILLLEGFSIYPAILAKTLCRDNGEPAWTRPLATLLQNQKY